MILFGEKNFSQIKMWEPKHWDVHGTVQKYTNLDPPSEDSTTRRQHRDVRLR